MFAVDVYECRNEGSIAWSGPKAPPYLSDVFATYGAALNYWHRVSAMTRFLHNGSEVRSYVARIIKT